MQGMKTWTMTLEAYRPRRTIDRAVRELQADERVLKAEGRPKQDALIVVVEVIGASFDEAREAGAELVDGILAAARLMGVQACYKTYLEEAVSTQARAA